MTSLMGGIFLAYLFSTSFTEQVQLNLTSVQKLVDYKYSLDFEQIIPGKLYNGSILATFAIPQSALAGIDGQSVVVKITAKADENSTIFFPVLSGAEAKQAEAYLRCDVANKSCANTSVLSADIPVFASAKPNETDVASITLISELVESAPDANAQFSAEGFLDSIKNAFQQNSSQGQENAAAPGAANQNAASQNILPSTEIIPSNLTNFSGAENFLDSFKPAGDSHDPVEFLRGNPLITITALVIVILITGAYLLNAKD